MKTIEKLTGKDVLEIVTSLNRKSIYEFAQLNNSHIDSFGKYINPLHRVYPDFECDGIFPHTYIKNEDYEVIFIYGTPEATKDIYVEIHDSYKNSDIDYVFCDMIMKNIILSIYELSLIFGHEYLLHILVGLCISYPDFLEEFKLKLQSVNLKNKDKFINNLENILENKDDLLYIAFSIAYSNVSDYDDMNKYLKSIIELQLM